jgi:hypothetical protein
MLPTICCSSSLAAYADSSEPLNVNLLSERRSDLKALSRIETNDEHQGNGLSSLILGIGELFIIVLYCIAA